MLRASSVTLGMLSTLTEVQFPHLKSEETEHAHMRDYLTLKIWKDNQEGWRTGFKEKVARMGAIEAGKGWICSLESQAIYFRLYPRTMGSHRRWERERSDMD